MASSTSTWILSLKVVLISVGIVSIAMATKFSVPLIIDFAVYEVPLMWSTLLSWLKPPYLYLIINGIIITIAASSCFYQKLDHHTHSQPLVSPKPPPSDLQSDFAAVSNQSEFRVLEPPVVYENEAWGLKVNRESLNGLEVGDEDEDKFVISTESEFRVIESPAVYKDEAIFPEVNDEVKNVNGSEVDDIQDEDEFVISNSTRTPPRRRNSSEIQSEYLYRRRRNLLFLQGSVTGNLLKPVLIPEGGRALTVAKPKWHETLETTWKMITDGRHMPNAYLVLFQNQDVGRNVCLKQSMKNSKIRRKKWWLEITETEVYSDNNLEDPGDDNTWQPSNEWTVVRSLY